MKFLNKEMRYDIVLSFAGEDRLYAEKLSNLLKERNLKVFYDRNYQASLWGADLTKFFARIYYNEALFCVSIISEAYKKKLWTSYEMRYIRDRQFLDEQYWLPLIKDEVEISGLRMTDGKIFLKDFSLEQIANMILEKVNERKNFNSGEEFESNNLEKQIMSILSDDGTEECVEVIIAFEFRDNKREYVVYTKNEMDKLGNTTVYVSEVNRSEGEPKLCGIDDEEEWKRIVNVLKELAIDDDDLSNDTNSTPLLGMKYDDEGIEII